LGRRLRFSAYALLGAAAALSAIWHVFARFAYYDDEGYVLLSIKEFILHGGLYSRVYSQYGPFTFELWGAVFKLLGGNVTTDRADSLVVIMWVAIALLIAVTADRVSGRLGMGLLAGIAGFGGVSVIAVEPLTPDDLCALLGILMLAAPVLVKRGRSSCVPMLGLLGAAALTTKLNIGGAMVLAVFLAVAATYTAQSPLGGLLVKLLIAAGVIMPFAVMRSGLNYAPNAYFAISMALGIASLGLALHINPAAPPASAPSSSSYLKRYLCWLAGGTAFVIAIVIATGTSPRYLVDGIVVWPLGLGSIYLVALHTSELAVFLGAAGLLWSVLRHWIVRRNKPIPLPANWLGAALRIVAGSVVLLCVCSMTWVPYTAQVGSICLAMPFMWLAANPPGRRIHRGESRLPRFLLAALPLYAAIGVYPVAGSQYGYASVLFVPGAAVILADGCAEIRALATARGWRFPRLTLGVTLAVIAFAAVQIIVRPAITGARLFYSEKPVSVSGVTYLRQAPSVSSDYKRLVATIRAHCATFVMLPGMDSFYLWTGIAPPTGLNAGDWMYLLSASQQQSTVDAIRNVRRLCLVRNNEILGIWRAGNPFSDDNWLNLAPLPSRPLMSFIETTRFKPILTLAGYTISVRGS
jgi:hypothetical protein